MKRFTATEKWDDSWFRKLPLANKCAWQFICDRCDAAGVWKVDVEALEFFIGSKFDEKNLLEAFGGRIHDVGRGKWWISKFITFQYGRLSRDCKPHIPIFNLLEQHGISLDDVEQTAVGSGKNGLPQAVREKVIERDGLICAYTGEEITKEDVWIDHVIPKSRGGSDMLVNLVVSSRWANSLKRDKSVQEFCISSGLDVVEVNERLTKRLGEAYSKASRSLQDKDKDKEEDKDKERSGGAGGEPPDPKNPNKLPALGIRICGWFSRRPTTQWSDRELRELRKVEAFKTPEDDILLLEQRYLSGSMYNRKEILTLLNNWNGEIDRCRSQTNGHGAATTADHAQGF